MFGKPQSLRGQIVIVGLYREEIEKVVLLMDKQAPENYDLLGGIVQDICFNNAYNAFNIPGVRK
jgi:hypothetical protein